MNRWLPAALFAAVAGVALACIGPWPVGVYWDDAVYVILAKAIATGQGYHYIHLPGAPAATHYPPAYPAFLAALWLVAPSFPANVVVFKVANALLVAASAVGAYVLGTRRMALRPPVAAGAVLLFTATIPVLVMSTALLSEPLFLALLFPALLAAERAVDDGGVAPAIWAGVLAGLLALVRTAGGALVPALAAALLVRRRPREAAAATIAATVVLLPWQLWVRAHAGDLPQALRGHYGPYLAWVMAAIAEHGAGFVARTVATNVAAIVRFTGVIFSPSDAAAPRLIATAALTLLVATGAWRVRRSAPASALFALAYLGVVLAWPFAPERFTFAVWPLVGLFVAAALAPTLAAVGERSRAAAARDWRLAAPLAAGALVLCGLLRYDARGFRGRWYESAQRQQAVVLYPLAEWVRRETREGDVVASDGHPMIYLYASRQAVPVTVFSAGAYLPDLERASAESTMKLVAPRYGARYVVVSGEDSASAVAAEHLWRASPQVLTLLTPLRGGGAAFTFVRQ